MSSRTAKVERKTLETSIAVELVLDGHGNSNFQTGVPFLEHMLDQISRHGLFDLNVVCNGDTHIDDHHTVEDIGIAMGEAFSQALGDRKGIVRYGHAYVPLDESLSRVVIDFSGRPGLHFNADFKRARVGNFDVDLTSEFFQGFANNARATIHMDVLRGVNDHHKIETLFKAFGRALRVACSIDDRAANAMPSTKGVL
ncbi:imidazoleglycerol-phosphate dehydratase HisB [Granulosicoccus antarcticus]|uniref:imidazoleglycerol-phosphate dehydratase HisB n=1 Tax=Granulosicoccus antarcticus TaxID=437505 RepID=UPI000B5AB16C|nr:imidazoleglycerol-phosphate dehydratase HisB [Granulosicoccus antarcticus]